MADGVAAGVRGMQTWVVLGAAVPADDIFDPQQRLRPVLEGSGPEIAWHDDDGQVISYDAVGLEVTAAGLSLAASPGAAEFHLTDRRVLVVARDGDGPGRHLLAQADLMCLCLVRTTADAGDDSRRRLEIGALTGGGTVEVFATSVDAEDVEAIAQGVHAKTRGAQSRGNLRPVTPEMMDALVRTLLTRSGTECRADFATANVTIPQLAALAYPRRYPTPAAT